MVEHQSILLFDQDATRRSDLSDYLSSHGFKLSEVESAAVLFDKMAERDCDLIILHLISRRADELTILSELREAGGPRCIIVTDKSDLIDRVVALELGADDYLSHPTDKRELLARVRAVLRRPMREPRVMLPVVDGVAFPERIKFDRVQRRLLHIDGSTTPLTTAEFNLLASFADNTNVSLTREKLYELVYNRRWSAYDRTLDTLVAKLRRKVERDPQNPELIKTVHGTGYIFTGVNFI